MGRQAIPVLLVAPIPLILLASFLSANVEAIMALIDRSNVYSLTDKNADTRNVLLLRSLDKGVLVYDLSAHGVSFNRWDTIEKVNRAMYLTRKERGSLCGAFEGLCSEPIVP